MPIHLQILRYVLVGFAALLLDVGCFMLLRAMSFELLTANIAARAAGAVCAFSGNYTWTFLSKSAASNVQRPALRYALWWVVATSVSSLLLPMVITQSPNEPLAKLMLELALVALNFVAAKMWIYGQGK